MTILQRFKRLSIWNKLAVLGSFLSIIALFLYFFPVIDSNHADKPAQVAGNNSMQVAHIAGNVVSNAPSTANDKQPSLRPSTPPSSFNTVETVFPMYLGSYWRYNISLVRQYDGPKIEKKFGQYTEKVISIDIQPDGVTRIIGTEISGTIFFSYCNDPDSSLIAQGDLTSWYVNDTHHVYHACTRENAYEIAGSAHTKGEAIINTPDEGSNKDSPEKVYPDYVVPFRVGNYWADEGVKREDTYYRYYVEAKETVSVPAGNFKNCFRIAYRTLPDSVVLWVCPGIGLVAKEYHHNGSIEDYRSELISYQIIPQ
ncbi:MAG: hypothetical protein HQK60_17455 [Deltaproteobacteria bacterium]|nr:hypothetical protein [Deltaproteobacteria bacterium]